MNERDEPPPEPVGRRVQGQIFRDGVYGRKPIVPVPPDVLEDAARRAVGPAAWDYTHGSAGMQRSARANREAFDRRPLVPRMLRDVESRDLSVELLGQRYPSPFLLSPIGVLELLHPEADLAVARAAAAAGVPMVVSTQASTPMEDIAAELAGAPWYFQLYWSRDDDLVTSLVRRAEAAGAAALVITLDTHVLGWRTQDLDRGHLPFARGLGIAQYTSDPVFQELVDRRVRAGGGDEDARRPTPQALRSLLSIARHHPGELTENLRSPHPRAAVQTFLDVFSRSSLTWENLAFIRDRTSLPIVLKGLQHSGDAERALDAGVDGIWVSNHGGRQVDGAIASLDALPGIVDAVDSRAPVIFDIGVRTGSDAVKALALGAAAVGIGRPYAYGLALAGADGVRQVIDYCTAELDITLALTGHPRVADLGRDIFER